MYPFSSLPENLAAFCETLRRQHAFHIGPGELHDAARALDVVNIADERAVRHALRPILVSRLDDIAVFDTAFTKFFLRDPEGVPGDELPSTRREPGSGPDGPAAEADRARRALPTDADADEAAGPSGGSMVATESTDDVRGEAAMLARTSYSSLEAIASDTPELPSIEQAWRDAAWVFVRRLHLGLSRRWRPSSRGRRFDLRRTLRASLQTGGEALSARWLQRPRQAPRIVLLVDGSRSMGAYAPTTLKVAVALASATMRVEVFTFSTRLERVTVDVRRAAAGESRRHLDRLHEAWAGGTAIGACLRDFLRRFGERMVGRQTVVIIASDGLDVGAPDLLRDSMRDLHRRSAGVVWLNPLLETKGYEPTAAGMRAARPYITTLTAIGDESSLVRLSRLVRLRA
jgi:uncharacterized protein with von Willebrand factor type A (vWA) domain